ncbi:hypothetical protein 7908G4G3_16 [Haloquadratum phage sp.]|nr:hypothetical protein 7908G4G3_16 [Haloquadratum phage sp.]
MATWELFRDGTKEQDLINVEYIDSANPFGDYVICQIEDNQGQKFDKFEYATEIEVAVTPDGGTQLSKFTGFVVERRENDQQGQDVLEVEAYSFDQFLRQNDVSNDQSGKLISDAIEDIIKTDTPVSFNANKVSVVDDSKLLRSLQDERVETALQILSFESGSEGFGVDDSLEFFFRPREQETITRGIDNSEWFNYDIPERGKEAVNEVEVRFDDGNRSVVVDNSSQKLDIQNSLNLPEPATQRARIARPNITNAKDAETEGRRFLKLKNVTLTGTITTFGLFEAEPFDTIDVEIIPRGIDSEFIVTQIEYNWGRDETTLTIVENRGFDEDLFVRLAAKTERIDLRNTDPDAVETRIISADVAANVDSEISTAGQSITSTTTNDGVDKIVSGWTGDGNPNISQIVVGDKATELSRADSELENQTNSISVSESLPTTDTVEYSATPNSILSGVEEIGLKDASGTLISRGVLDSPANLFQTITVTLTVDDATESNGVVTNTGQTAIRDIIADNNPQIPTQYEFGVSVTTPTESDASLTSSVASPTDLDRIELQDVSSQTELNDALPSFPDDSPVKIANGELTVNPVTYITEAEAISGSFNTGTVVNQSGSTSNNQAVRLDAVGDFVLFQFDVNQDVPAGELSAGIYANANNFDGEIEYSFDTGFPGGGVYRTTTLNNVSFENRARGFLTGVNANRLEAGTTHQITVTVDNAASGSFDVDVMYAFDDRFGISTPGKPAFTGATFEHPELYPDSITVSFNDVNAGQIINGVETVQDWNDTSNNAAITLNLGSQSKTVNNPVLNVNGNIKETLTVSKINSSETGNVDVTLSRFNDPANDNVPLKGDAIQAINSSTLTGILNPVTRSDIGEATTRAFFKAGVLQGNTLRESGQKAGSSLLTHSIFADVDPENDIIIGSERIQFIPK